jgi:hypothetical protein
LKWHKARKALLSRRSFCITRPRQPHAQAAAHIRVAVVGSEYQHHALATAGTQGKHKPPSAYYRVPQFRYAFLAADKPNPPVPCLVPGGTSRRCTQMALQRVRDIGNNRAGQRELDPRTDTRERHGEQGEQRDH